MVGVLLIYIAEMGVVVWGFTYSNGIHIEVALIFQRTPADKAFLCSYWVLCYYCQIGLAGVHFIVLGLS